MKNKIKKTEELISYYFNNSKSIEDNDIPFYHPNIPDNFSLFCSEFEYRQILRHLKTKEYKLQLEEKKLKMEEEQKLKTEPEPNKKNFLCQICKARFDNYIEHIRSNMHKKNKKKFDIAYINIKNTFNRIVENNKSKNVNNINNNNEVINNHKKNELFKNKNNNLNIFENNLFISTKEDSISVKEENRIIKGDITNLEKITEKEVNEKNQQNKKKDSSISVNEILTILNTIEIKQYASLKKRKKNKLNVKYVNDNDYLGDFKKITGKIGYYNNLLIQLND